MRTHKYGGYKFTFESKNKKDDKVIFVSDDYVSCKELYNNPFSYVRKSNESTVYVDSIEDFGVNYKGNDVYFGSFVRSPKISKRNKIKYTKKYFRNWRKDFKNNKKSILEKTNSISKEYKDYKLTNSLILVYTILTIVVVVWYSLLFLLKKDLSFENSLFLKIFSISMITVSWIDIILIFVVCLIYLYIFKLKRNKVNKVSVRYKKINNVFNRVYNKTLKYYIKMIKKEKVFYESIKIDEITCSEDFNEALNELDLIKNKIHNSVNQLHYLKKIYRILFWIISVVSLILLGVIIYLVIKNL